MSSPPFFQGQGPLTPFIRWNPVFFQRRDFDRQEENMPFVETNSALRTETDIMGRFMKGANDQDPCPYKADKVLPFCSKATLSLMEADLAEVAVLEDRDIDGGIRPYPAILTSHALYQALREQRFRIKKVTGETITQTRSDDPAAEKPDASRRLIFIANLGQSSILAIAATASVHQVHPLRDAIFHHLDFKPGIGVSIPPEGSLSFTMAFHLPCFALRRSRFPRKDDRARSDGTQLRTPRSVAFLSQPTGSNRCANEDRDYLYPVQLSCMITGHDHWTWAAYAFIDTYHEDPELEKGENIEDYEDNGCIAVDPLTAGKRTRDRMKPIWDPRAYFLTVLDARVRQFSDEWNNTVEIIVEMIAQKIEDYKRRHLFQPPEILGRFKSYARDSEARTELRPSGASDPSSWVSETVFLLRDLSKCIDSTLDVWELFLEGDMYYFMAQDRATSMPETTNCSIIAIHKVFRNMRLRSTELKNIIKEISEDIPRDITLQLARENHESAILQQNSTKDVNMLTYIAFISLPVALTASLLSTQSGFIPIPVSPWAALILFIVLELVVWLAFDSMGKRWCSKKLGGASQVLAMRIIPHRFREQGAEPRNTDDLGDV